MFQCNVEEEPKQTLGEELDPRLCLQPDMHLGCPLWMGHRKGVVEKAGGHLDVPPCCLMLQRARVPHPIPTSPRRSE